MNIIESAQKIQKNLDILNNNYNYEFDYNEINFINTETVGKLYLGNKTSNRMISKLSISVVFRFTNHELSNFETDILIKDKVDFYVLNVDDNESDADAIKMITYINQYIDQIHKLLLSGKNILIYCDGGVSRSPTFVAAYLIKYKKMMASDSLLYLKTKRHCIYPNLQFINILVKFYNNLVNEKIIQKIKKNKDSLEDKDLISRKLQLEKFEQHKVNKLMESFNIENKEDKHKEDKHKEEEDLDNMENDYKSKNKHENKHEPEQAEEKHKKKTKINNEDKLNLNGIQCMVKCVSVYDGDTITVEINFKEIIKKYYSSEYKHSIYKDLIAKLPDKLVYINCRLASINSAELKPKNKDATQKAAEKARGILDKQFLSNIILGKYIWCNFLTKGEGKISKLKKYDPYNRPIVDLFLLDENGCKDINQHINSIMLSSGHAALYDGTGEKKY